MEQRDTGLLRDDRHREVLDCADARGRIGDLARRPPRPREQLRERRNAERRVDHDQHARLGEFRDRRVRGHRIDHGRHRQRGQERHERPALQQRIAVGRSARDRFAADVGRCARHVLDEDRLLQRIRELRANEARGDVGLRAGGERNHEPDRSRRIGDLRERGRREQGKRGERERVDDVSHDSGER